MSDTLDLTIDGIAQGGEGVGRCDGQVVFARGGLPGEQVRLRITERKTSYLRGEVIMLLEASPDRVEPRLLAGDHAPWQHIAYPAQLRFKETILRDQLAKLAGLHELNIAPIIAAPQPWGYRNTAHLHVAGTDLGYYAAGTRAIEPLTADPLLLTVLNQAITALAPLLPPDLISGVTLRASHTFGYAIAMLHVAPGAEPDDLDLLAAAWRAHAPGLAGVGAAWRGRPVIEPDGAATLHEVLAGITYELGPESFFQANVPQAETLVELALAALEPAPGKYLLDLYSGVGAFALPMAAAGASVVAVEEHPGAVEDGRQSANLNGVTGVRFVRGAVERALPPLEGSFDGVLLDPPRRGCHPAVLEALAEQRPPRLVYVSCHPGILGRDLPPLLRAGYQITQIQPVDLLPQTPHIETVVTLDLG
ncbi:MAG: class I SAM-dependent RNA methyltransferase [Oscillochloridaceae bacterium umkhey_bin13]